MLYFQGKDEVLQLIREREEAEQEKVKQEMMKHEVERLAQVDIETKKVSLYQNVLSL